MIQIELPLPPHFNPESVGKVWQIPYLQRAQDARSWAVKHRIQPAKNDSIKISLVLIDLQNTFCIPGFELFVAGRSGTGAVEDNRRLCEFIYRNLGRITRITVTLDTHTPMQIFHPLFLINADGNHPEPHSTIKHSEILNGKWKFNPAVADSLGITPDYGQQHLMHYTKTLMEQGKYELTIWPYHAMLGSIGYALVASVEEAVIFHSFARISQAEMEVKGRNPLTEHYSVIGPEVMFGSDGELLENRNKKFIQKMHDFDRIIIAGQAKSHCVAWTIDDLLGEILQTDEELVKKVYLLEDCTSPVVVPGLVDYTIQADDAFKKYQSAGMHVVQSSTPMTEWSDFFK